MKKIFTIFMCMTMLVCFMPSMAFAEGTYASACTLGGCSDVHVASVNARSYHSLSDAIAEAESGDVITIMASTSVNATETVVVTRDIDIDLNGYTVTWNTSAQYAFKITTGDLTIKDGSESNAGELAVVGTFAKSNNSGIYVGGTGLYDAKFTLQDGKISYESVKSSAHVVQAYSGMTTINGGTIETKGQTTYGVYFLGATSATQDTIGTVTGGKIQFADNSTANHQGIYVSSAKDNVTISDVTVDGTGTSVVVRCVYNSSGTTIINGGTFNAGSNVGSLAVNRSSGNVEIKDGIFIGKVTASTEKYRVVNLALNLLHSL